MSQQGSAAGLSGIAGVNADLAAPGSVVLPPHASPAQIDAFIKANYGYMSWALAVPELRAILEKVVGPNGITVDQNAFDGLIRATTWFKNSTQAMRTYAQLMGEDPATAQAQLDKQTADIKHEATTMGLNLDANSLQEMATQSIAYSWDKPMMDEALYAETMRQTFAGTAQAGRISGPGRTPGDLTGSGLDSLQEGNPLASKGVAYNGALKRITGNPFGGGTLADYYDKVQALANQYMVTLSPDAAAQMAIGEATGVLDPTAIEGNMIKLAIGKFPSLRQEIEGGITPAQLFDPIKQQVSKTLEVAPDSINWMDPKYQQLFQYQPPQTGTGPAPSKRPMTITEADNWARSQPDWMKTQQAQDQSSSTVKALLGAFGAAKF